MKKKHRHLFKHIGGGCRLNEAQIKGTDKQCDDEFRCRCGRREKIYTTIKQHLSLPQIIGLKKLNAIEN